MTIEKVHDYIASRGATAADWAARDLGVTEAELLAIVDDNPEVFEWQPRSRLDGPGKSYLALRSLDAR